MNIKPLKDRVLIEPKEAQEKTEGGIYLPDISKDEKVLEGKVVAIGESKDCQLKVGQKVLFEAFSGVELKTGGKKYFLLETKDVLAIIE